MQRLRRLLHKRSARQADGVFVAEGATLVREALASGRVPESLFYAPGADPALVRDAAAAGAAVHALADGVIEAVADAVTPQPVCAVLAALDTPIDALADDGVVVVAVDVRDPGNAGTLIRSAAAAGARGVVLCDGCVELYNPKTVRATAGALFRLPVVTSVSVNEALSSLGAAGRRRLAAVATGGDDYATVDLTGPVAFVVGNEAHGLPATLPGIDAAITIPMPGSTESLNVGVATAVLCFEAARQARAAVA
ncbi:MAG TPA: RNA methyltransferase [Acidimicrobiales bacterium]|nr:RNA methyltransferase [Acidimicrobiales bacterium]